MAGVDKIIGEILEEAEMKTDRKLRKKPMQFWKMRKRNVQRLKKRRTRR